MKITRESLEKSLELAEKCLDEGQPWFYKFELNDLVDEDANFIVYHKPEFITAVVQAHIEALEVIQFYADKEKWDWDLGIGRRLVSQKDCEFLVLNNSDPGLTTLTGGKRARKFLSKNGGVK